MKESPINATNKVIVQMTNYAKFLKEIMLNKKNLEGFKVFHYSLQYEQLIFLESTMLFRCKHKSNVLHFFKKLDLQNLNLLTFLYNWLTEPLPIQLA
ncbi:hypothetical protein CR513_07382, partial [Mucuna pruriens]